MKLKVVNTGSVGNCFIFHNAHTALIVECGVAFMEIKKALSFDLGKVAGAIVTHEHLDHAVCVKDVVKAGIDVYASPGTIKATNVQSHRLKPINPLQRIRIGEFTVMAFDVEHDCAQPYGYIINHPEMGDTLFVTDTCFVPFTFKNLSNVLIEANYCPGILAKREAFGNINRTVRDRVVNSHMSIDTCIEALAANDLSRVNNLLLIHLSDGNSNAAQFEQRVKDATGIKATAAYKGLEIDFNKTPF